MGASTSTTNKNKNNKTLSESFPLGGCLPDEAPRGYDTDQLVLGASAAAESPHQPLPQDDSARRRLLHLRLQYKDYIMILMNTVSYPLTRPRPGRLPCSSVSQCAPRKIAAWRRHSWKGQTCELPARARHADHHKDVHLPRHKAASCTGSLLT